MDIDVGILAISTVFVDVRTVGYPFQDTVNTQYIRQSKEIADIYLLLAGLGIALLQVYRDHDVSTHLTADIHRQIVEHATVNEQPVAPFHRFEDAWYGH